MTWLDWARELQAIAQTGAAYDAHPYHAERYERVGRIAAEMMAAGLGEEVEAIEQSFAGERGHATPKVDVRAAAFRRASHTCAMRRSRPSSTSAWASAAETRIGSPHTREEQHGGFRHP